MKTNHMARRGALSLVVIATALSLALAGCSDGGGGADPDTADTGPIRIGVTTSTTGNIAPPCLQQLAGAQAAVDAANKAGGVNGRQIKLDVVDDANDASKAVANARKFIEDKDFAAFGTCSTAISVAIAPILSSAKMPFVFPYAAAAALYTPPQDYVYTVNPAYAQQASTLLAIAVAELKEKGVDPKDITVGEVEANVAGFQDTIDALAKQSEALGVNFSGVILTANGTADYGPTALKVKAINPTILFVQSGAPDGARLVKALDAANAIPEYFLGVSSMASDAFLSAGGNLLGSHLRLLSPTPAVQSVEAPNTCLDALKANNTPVEPQALWGCGAGQLLVGTLKAAGPDLTTESYLKALQSQTDAQLSDVFPAVNLSSKSHLALGSMYLMTLDGDKLTSSKETVELK